MRKLVNFCDYFVICSGNSDRQVKAIADGIQEGMESVGLTSGQKQADRAFHWILVDFGNVVVHIFERDTREFYGIEYLWQDAKKIPWNKS